MDVSPQELDLNLARILTQAGVDAEALEACLAVVAERRAQGGDAALAAVLLERRAIPAQTLIEALTQLAGRGGTLRDGSSGRVASRLPRAPEIDGYRITQPLAQGGMGAVYEAQDERGRRVAIKVIKADPDLDPDGEDLARFRREGVLLAALDHPHIGRVQTADLERDDPYIVQDLLTGGSLADRLRREGPLTPEAAVDLGVKLAGALSHAHARGILHRDLKPKNVVFDERGEPQLIDFGLARRLGRQSLSLTVTGQVLGTPAFMAPEQALGHASADERTDVYGLGALLHAALSGEPPFRGQLIEVLQAVIHDPPPSLRAARPELPRGLERVIAIAMAKEPEARYPSCDALARALREYPREETLRTAARVAWAAVGVLAVGVALVLALRGAGSSEVAGAAPSSAPPPPPATATPPAASPRARGGPPAWYRERDKRQKPRWLPPGLRFGAQDGEYVNAKDGTVLVWVPAGAFKMGDPPKRVRISRGYFIGKYEVSWAQYRRFCRETDRAPPFDRIKHDGREHRVPDDHPVFNVTWADCAAYAAWAGLRLPTDAEWEYAARGSDGRAFPWGDAPPGPERLNLADRSTGLGWREPWSDPHVLTAPVVSYPRGASPFGALNMSGNIHEFVHDFSAPNYQVPDGAVDPQGPRHGSQHVIRGGCWKSHQRLCRPAGRHSFFPNDTLGFRCARSAD